MKIFYSTLACYLLCIQLIAQVGHFKVAVNESLNNKNVKWQIPCYKGFNKDSSIYHILKGNSLMIKKREYMIDSIVTYYEKSNESREKDIFEYDENGNTIKWLSMECKNDIWAEISNHTYQYDKNNILIIFIFEQGYSDSSIIKKKYSYKYNHNYIKISELSQLLKDSIWINYDSISYDYNEKGLLINNTLQRWYNNRWKNYRITTYSYDNNGNLLSMLSDAGTILTKDTFYYDLDGNMILHLFQTKSDSIWKNADKKTYFYDPNKNLMCEIFERWNLPMMKWYNYYKYTYSYNTDNKKVIKLIESGNQDNYNWVNYARNSFEYDKNGHLIKQFMEIWRNGEWIPGDTTGMYFYLDEITPFFEQSKGYKLEIFYNPATSVPSIANKMIVKLTISPNPVNGILNINYILTNPAPARITITNILGLAVGTLAPEVNSNAGNNTLEFDASALPPGVYFCTLQTPECTITKQFVVVR